MKIIEAQEQDRSLWDQFVKENELGSFLQSWDWGEFIREYRQARVWRFLVSDNDELTAVVFFHQGKLRLKQNYLSAPRGPVLKKSAEKDKAKILAAIMERVDEIAKEEDSLYVQFEPYSADYDWAAALQSVGFVKSRENVMPRYTLVLDIASDEAELMAKMHTKTRYNIRLAQKKGVEIIIDNSRVDDFYALLQETARRQGVTFFSKAYFDVLLRQKNTKLYLAKYEDEVVAANIVVWWDDMATYLFGGTGLKHRNVMAPHLLQWQAIQDAKKAGLTRYDFWGAVPDEVKGPEKKWAGVTRFKKGFCPQTAITTYVGTYEKLYHPKRLKAYKWLRRFFGL